MYLPTSIDYFHFKFDTTPFNKLLDTNLGHINYWTKKPLFCLKQIVGRKQVQYENWKGPKMTQNVCAPS
jgi:hypothetical protein